jgi:eukaryotic-like serine/threonine-protein kinase
MAVRHEELQSNYRFDDFQIDARKRILLRAGSPVALNSKAFDLLLVLLASNGRDLSKAELIEKVWQDQIVEENNLAVHIYNLRKILGERKDEHRYILTIPGVGYRFVAEVYEVTDDAAELLIESRTVSRIVVEEEGDGEEVGEAALQAARSGYREMLYAQAEMRAEPSPTGASRHAAGRGKRIGLAAIAVALILAMALGTYWLYQRRFGEPVKPAPGFHRQIRLTRVTNSGRIGGAALSPDGRFVAYILGESEGNSLWLRQTGTASDIRILPPAKAEFFGLLFSPDGRFIYYNLFAGNQVDYQLYRVPSLGGAVEKIPQVSSCSITFSPDGKRLAYIQSDSDRERNSLVLADVEGTNHRVVASKAYPNTFYAEGPAVAWSPDGRAIACLVNQFDAEANYFSVIGISPLDGSETPLSERRWYEASGIAWLKGGLLVSAKEKLSGQVQIWSLPDPQGEPLQLTNDLNQYCCLSVSADGESLAAVQTNTVNTIFVGDVGAREFQEIASEAGELDPLVWTPGGKLVFRSSRDGLANLWLMDADGANRRQLTLQAYVDSRGLCVSPDGRYIVFVSWRSGKANLWRIDADGSNPIQLTDGAGDVHPRCTPDGAAVIFQRGIYSKPTLWRVPMAGGAAEPLSESRAKWAAISNDGSRLSYFHMSGGKWHIGIIPASGGALLQSLEAPANLRQNTVYWSPDNRALFYIGATGSVGNIWSLPLDGAAARPLSVFTSHWLSDFSVSADGRQLALTRSHSVSDVVLIQTAPAP